MAVGLANGLKGQHTNQVNQSRKDPASPKQTARGNRENNERPCPTPLRGLTAKDGAKYFHQVWIDGNIFARISQPVLIGDHTGDARRNADETAKQRPRGNKVDGGALRRCQPPKQQQCQQGIEHQGT
ncbi:hypothetical protein EKH22_16625 [Salmonella enterica subsp. enterica serovar Bispebjerg]|nr:hypothetical protein [Salmonella enterica subsp. enterica serovar Bispebjerg]